jgi:hypothetical protein
MTSCWSSSTCCRGLRQLAGSRTPRRQGTKRTISSQRRWLMRRRQGGCTLVASGDRDAFQLASGLTTLLHPVRAGEMGRIGPAEVRERYGVEPKQVPDFIALRGDPSDKLPGARGVGPQAAAALLAYTAPLKAHWQRAASRSRRRSFGCIAGSRPWTPQRPFPPFAIRGLPGTRRLSSRANGSLTVWLND